MSGESQTPEIHEFFLSRFREDARNSLEKFRKTYEKTNDGGIIIHCVNLCGYAEIPMPGWLAKAFSERLRLFWAAEVKNLGEAFDMARPRETKQYLNALKKRMKNQESVYHEIEATRAKKGAAIDQELFDEVGKNFFISGSTARDYYYDHKSLINLLTKT